MQYVLAQAQGGNPDIFLHSISTHTPAINPDAKLTEVQAEDLYFCLENIAIQEIIKEYQRQKTNQRSRKGGSARKPQQYHAEAEVII